MRTHSGRAGLTQSRIHEERRELEESYAEARWKGPDRGRNGLTPALSASTATASGCRAEQVAMLSRALERPVMIGEWHFGALDAGLPASGIGHVRTQDDRGRAYRVYLEQAAALPACIGVHYFTLYDQSALGRFDGENYQIGYRRGLTAS